MLGWQRIAQTGAAAAMHMPGTLPYIDDRTMDSAAHPDYLVGRGFGPGTALRKVSTIDLAGPFKFAGKNCGW